MRSDVTATLTLGRSHAGHNHVGGIGRVWPPKPGFASQPDRLGGEGDSIVLHASRLAYQGACRSQHVVGPGIATSTVCPRTDSPEGTARLLASGLHACVGDGGGWYRDREVLSPVSERYCLAVAAGGCRLAKG